MDTQTLINAAFSLVFLTGGWLAREVWDAVKTLQKDMHQIEVDLPKEYVLRVDLDKRMEHIEYMFQRIYDKLDSKQDRV